MCFINYESTILYSSAPFAVNPDVIPEDLVFAPIPFFPANPEPYTKALISSKMRNCLTALFNAAKCEGLSLYGISAYRSYYRQLEIYNNSIAARGYEHTKKYIATPGTSEHQTGLAIDVSCPCVNFDLIEEFAYTKEGIWLRNNVRKYGFRLTYDLYPACCSIAADSSGLSSGKRNHDSYIAYEPWHIYFCGNENKI